MRRWPRGPLSLWFVAFFASIGTAALAGAVGHGGFARDATSVVGLVPRIVLGVAALAAWRITAAVLDDTTTGRWLARLATIEFFVYCGVVLFVTRSFTAAIVNYVPALAVLFIVFARGGRPPPTAGPRGGGTSPAP